MAGNQPPAAVGFPQQDLGAAGPQATDRGPHPRLQHLVPDGGAEGGVAQLDQRRFPLGAGAYLFLCQAPLGDIEQATLYPSVSSPHAAQRQPSPEGRAVHPAHPDVVLHHLPVPPTQEREHPRIVGRIRVEGDGGPPHQPPGVVETHHPSERGVGLGEPAEGIGAEEAHRGSFEQPPVPVLLQLQLRADPPGLDGVPDGAGEELGGEGLLGQALDGSGLHGRLVELGLPFAGEKDQRARRDAVHHPPDQLHPGAGADAVVDQVDVVTVGGHLGQRLLGRASRLHDEVVGGGAQEPLDQETVGGVVVDEQDAGRRSDVPRAGRQVHK